MGSMCHGYSASVSVITRTSLQDTAGKSPQPAALSSVSVAITAKCLWLHSSSPSRGVRPEMYHPAHAPVPLLLCSRCQRGVTQGGVCLDWCPCPCKNRFELQTIGGRSVWRTGPLYGAVTRARLFRWRAQGQKLAVWAMLAPAFDQSPKAQESTLYSWFVWGHIAHQHQSMCVKTGSLCDFTACIPFRYCCFLSSRDIEDGFMFWLFSINPAESCRWHVPASSHPSQDDGKRKLGLIFHLTKWQSWHFWMNTSLKINIAFAILAQMLRARISCSCQFHPPSRRSALFLHLGLICPAKRPWWDAAKLCRCQQCRSASISLLTRSLSCNHVCTWDLHTYVCN